MYYINMKINKGRKQEIPLYKTDEIVQLENILRRGSCDLIVESLKPIGGPDGDRHSEKILRRVLGLPPAKTDIQN